MKQGCENKIKFKKLQRRLMLSRWQCTGLLETLWHVTIENAWLGDIGKLSNEDIAAAMEWAEDADELITALIEAGWIDKHQVHRLVIHDWSFHCPTFLKGNVAKYHHTFADVSPNESPNERQKELPNERPIGTSLKSVPPSQAKPSQAKPPPLAENWSEEVEEMRRSGISKSKAETLVFITEDTAEEFRARLRLGIETIALSANAGKFKSDTGALVHWIEHGEWPVEGVTSPEEAAASTQATLERNADLDAQKRFDALVRRWGAKGDSEVAKRAMAAGFTKEFCEGRGFSPADTDESH